MFPVALRLVVAAIFGLGYWYATALADFSEQLDAVGSKRDGPVEAATWKRTLYKLGFGVATALTVLWTLAGLFDAVASAL